MTTAPSTPLKTAVSWSAGKDSCLALLRAREAGLDVCTFLTMLDTDDLSKSHALPRELIAAQVAVLGGTWQPAVVGPGDYGSGFAAQLALLRAAGHTHMVFGDIDLQAHRDWLEPACERAGLQAVFPLWGLSRDAVAREIIARGIRARIVCVDTRWLDESHCGVDYDEAFLARLPAGVCPCGEDGEFHSFVWDGPGFARPLVLAGGVRRRVASQPPLSPTELVFQAPVLMMRT
ncbi:MAG TPA: adenosine nucleotide hydrolase [Ideonella sp.]|uniref:Dph6-related ATP pyrophosphatase n=1 Tax=Ideonella sp. TaxID=1929293 RepID=UPI002E2F3314|nr:adenosine nucleotide hydrolase [Ideonella sp.]HEX5686845.1 adenosine nucleotide hydrolase [Ideonella sp.]